MNDGGGLARVREAGQESSDQELLCLAYRSLVPVRTPGIDTRPGRYVWISCAWEGAYSAVHRNLVPVSIDPGVEVHRWHRVGRGVGQTGDDVYQVDL